MDVTTGRAGAGEPVERFKPTNGMFVGWCGVVSAVLVIAYVALTEHSVVGLRYALGAVFAGVVMWVTHLRPRVTAYADCLVLHGMVSDVTVPYAAVQDVTMGQTLNVWAGGRRYVCVGIGRSVAFETRQRMRARGSGGLLGANRVTHFGEQPAAARDLPTTYQAFVLRRIDDLMAAARSAQRSDPGERPEVRKAYVVPVLAALVGTGAAFLVSLLV